MNSKKNKNTEKILCNGVKESDFLQVLDNISKRLIHKFKFGYHSFEDMKQQAAIFALEGLEKYDKTRPLENFLWTHVRNRLFNYKRNNYQRPDKPCFSCPFYDKLFKESNNQCSKYVNKDECDLFSAWKIRNDTKKNIAQPSYIDDNSNITKQSTDISLIIQDKEIIQFLDDNVIYEYREYYLKLKHGIKIPKQHLIKLQAYILKLMENLTCQTMVPKNEDN